MDRIGEYLVSRMVGEGGMGKVYEAEERLSRRRVALKVLRPELGRSEEGRRLFLNEMAILSHLDHPNVVRCLACTEAEDQLVMVLEFLEGQTLREVLTRDGALPWPRAVQIGAQVAAALSAAHGREPPVVHRDLKPENVMVMEGGLVKVMDFGIAKVLEAVARATTQSVGTLQYMSPEQIDAGKVDGRTDLYALGLILYEMLRGRPPFESPSPRDLLNLQCTAAPPPLPDEVRMQLPRGVGTMLFRLLEKAPADRPASAAEVLAELERFAPADVREASGARTVRTNADLGAPSTVSATSPGAASAGGASTPSTLSTPGPSSRKTLESPRASGENIARTPEPGQRPAPRADTMALVDRVSGSREVSPRTALLVVVLLSALAGGATYLVRRSGGASAQPTAAGSVEPPARTAAGAGEVAVPVQAVAAPAPSFAEERR